MSTLECGARRACSRSAFQSHMIYKLFIRLACLSISLQATNWLLRHLRMAPEGLFKACPPAACTIARPDLPARFGTPVDLRSTPIRERGFAAYLSGCARQPFIVRCAHYARGGASLTTFGFVTIVPRYLLPQVMPSHSFAARTRAYCAPHKRSWKPTNACQCQPPRAPRRGIGVRTRQRHLAARACCAPRKWRFGLNYTVMALPTNQCLPVPAAARPRRA